MRRTLWLAVFALVATQSVNAFACAACYGRSDAPMARGMNWGIFVLLGIISVVLSGVAGFFVYLAKKPDTLPNAAAAGKPEQPTNQA